MARVCAWLRAHRTQLSSPHSRRSPPRDNAGDEAVYGIELGSDRLGATHVKDTCSSSDIERRSLISTVPTDELESGDDEDDESAGEEYESDIEIKDKDEGDSNRSSQDCGENEVKGKSRLTQSSELVGRSRIVVLPYNGNRRRLVRHQDADRKSEKTMEAVGNMKRTAAALEPHRAKKRRYTLDEAYETKIARISPGARQDDEQKERVLVADNVVLTAGIERPKTEGAGAKEARENGDVEIGEAQ